MISSDLKHSHLGASSAHRWMNCPGSVALGKNIPKTPSNPSAFQGTAAHFVLAECLQGRGVPDDYVGYIYEGKDEDFGMEYELTEDDCENIRVTFDEVQRFLEDGYKLYSEVRFSLEAIHKGMFGTSDIVLVREGHLVVIDFKFGKNYPVSPVDNWQLIYYALGDLHSGTVDSLMGYDKVTVGISQPRCSAVHPNEYWDVPMDVFKGAPAHLKDCAERTEDPNAPCITGSWCTFCPARGVCKAQDAKVNEVLETDDFDVLTRLPDPRELSSERIREILAAADHVKEFLKAVEGAAEAFLQSKTYTSEELGVKLVEKRPNRKWANEGEAELTLSKHVKPADLWEKKFKTPAKVESLAKGPAKKALVEVVKTLTVTPKAGTTIAPLWDKRPEVAGEVDGMFENLTSEEGESNG